LIINIMGDKNYKDALIYSGIKNNMIDDASMAGFGQITSQYQTSAAAKAYLDSVLSNTTIKRACCSQTTYTSADPTKAPDPIKVPGIPVFIPVPTGYNLDDDNQAIRDVEKKFKYKQKMVYVPDSICASKQLVPYEATCNTFYNVYCKNMMYLYKQELAALGKTFDAQEWKNLKPDCACYGEVNSSYDSNGVPHKCYMPGCRDDNPYVYFDPDSRGKQCNSAICQSIFDLSNSQVGGAVNINQTVTQNCNGSGARPTAPVAPIVPPAGQQPIVPPAGQPIVPPAGQPIVPPAGQPIVPPAGQPIVPPAGQPIVPPAGQPIVPPAGQPIVPPAGQPIVPPAGQPIVPVAKSVAAQPSSLIEGLDNTSLYIIIAVIVVLLLCCCSSSIGVVMFK
jgi:hypothetical protein